jgi:hypothetical protein
MPESQMEVLVGQPPVKTVQRKISPARWLVSGIAAVAVLGIVGLLIATFSASKDGFGLFGSSDARKADLIKQQCIEQNLSAFDCLIKTQEASDVGSAWLPLAKNVELRQENNGFKLTVRKVYADAHSVVIGYELMSTTAIQVSLAEIDLLDENGNPFGRAGSNMMGLGSASLASFNGSSITGNPSSIKARFQVKNITVMPGPPTTTNPAPPSSSNLPPDSSGTTQRLQTTEIPVNFEIELEIPYFGGQNVELNQKVKAGDRELILERAIVARSGTQLYLSGVMPGRFVMEGELNTGGQVVRAGWGVPQPNTDILGWSRDLTPYLGQNWTLTVSELSEEKQECRQGINQPPCNPLSGPPKRWTSGGPWKFTFKLEK